MRTTEIRNENRMHEVAIVYKRPVFDSMPQISNSQDAYEIIKKFIDTETIDLKEFFWVLLLNRCNRVLGYSEIGKGDTHAVIVNVKEIFQLVLKTNASAIILCHNHPSGNLNKSKTDEELTEKINIIGQLFSITLLDHIIITSEGFYSFSKNGDILVPDNTLPF